MSRLTMVLLACCLATALGAGPTVNVWDADGLHRALRSVGPGTSILVAPGDYHGSFSASGLRGTPAQPILIAAADPARPPVLHGRAGCIHLSDASHVVLRDLVLVGAKSNGLNIDDGGTYDTPAHHIVLENLTVRDVGPEGNCDGIKLSGVDDFLVRRCTVERWGSGGSAIDMVGCHRGLIVDCGFTHNQGRGASGVQAKGGSSEVVVFRCRFLSAGQRAINLGGSTGRDFFRPLAPGYEARRLAAIGNVFVGSAAPLAFVGADECEASYNTLYRPGQWAFRILQEDVGPDLVPCRNGTFRANLVVWRWRELATTVNIGPHTAPETFHFEGNWWYCEDRPARSRPYLPAAETGGVVGQDPDITVEGSAVEAARVRDQGAGSPLAAKLGASVAGRLAPWAWEQAASIP